MTHVGLLSVNLASLISLSSSLCADMTPCMSPLPQDGHLQDKSSPSLGLIQEETEVINSIMGNGVVDTSTGALSQKYIHQDTECAEVIRCVGMRAHLQSVHDDVYLPPPQTSLTGRDLEQKREDTRLRRKGRRTSVGLSLFVRL